MAPLGHRLTRGAIPVITMDITSGGDTGEHLKKRRENRQEIGRDTFGRSPTRQLSTQFSNFGQRPAEIFPFLVWACPFLVWACVVCVLDRAISASPRSLIEGRGDQDKATPCGKNAVK